MRLDETAWREAGTIMDRALSELTDLEAGALERTGGAKGELSLGSFLMSLFESPPDRL